MDLLGAFRLVDECLGLVRLKRDFAVINNLIDRYKEALAKFYDGWADDFAGKAVDVKNEFQWFALRDGALRGLEQQMVAFGNELLPEAFEMGLTDEMTDELKLALQKEIAVNNIWIRNSLVPNIRQLSEGYWEDRDEYPKKGDVKAIWMRRAYQVGQYAGAAWTAFWTGRVEEQPPTTFWLWEGSIDDNTCSDCLGRIGMVYRADQLPGIPGDASTACGCNCRCWLEEINAWLMGMLDPMLGGAGDPMFDKRPGKLNPKKPALSDGQAAKMQEVIDRSGKELAGDNTWSFNKLKNDPAGVGLKIDAYGIKHWNCDIFIHPDVAKKLNAVFANPEILLTNKKAVQSLRTLNHEMHHGINPVRPTQYSGVVGMGLEEGLAEALSRDRLPDFATMLFGPEIGINLASAPAYSYTLEAARVRQLALLASGGEPARVTDIMLGWKRWDNTFGRTTAMARDISNAWGGESSVQRLVFNYVNEEDFWVPGKISNRVLYDEIALRAEGFDSGEWLNYFKSIYPSDTKSLAMKTLVDDGRALLREASVAKTPEEVRIIQAELKVLIEQASGRMKEELIGFMEAFEMLAEARELES